MELLWHELMGGLPDRRQLAFVLIRVIAAALLGGIVGLQRERARKPAGLRTHMLVCLGTSVIVLAGSGAGMSTDGLSRLIQGIVTGIGFVGAGSILKLSQEHEIRGLTTAAGLWMTAAIGVACGVGALGLAVIATIIAVMVLALESVEKWWEKDRKKQI
jgi:putative Mg2+ transporter-C (MgtC) family protein